MESDILTIEEVAEYLRVSPRTVYDWAQKGEIPAGKIGTVWRFKKNEIENWVNLKLSTQEQYESPEVQIKNFLSPDRVVFINHSSKRDTLVALADVLGTAPQVKNATELTSEIFKREELMSTAIGLGVAVPHVRLSSVTDLVMAVGVCKKTVEDFQTIDDIPVQVLFMIAAATNQRDYYLKVISFLSAKIKDNEIRSKIISATTEREIYDLLISK